MNNEQKATLSEINEGLAKLTGVVYEYEEQLQFIQNDLKDIHLATALRMLSEAYSKIEAAASKVADALN